MYTININTDWWIFGATIGAGILAALATWFAVVYTNKKNSEIYERGRIVQEKANAMVILKPTIKFCTFGKIIEDLILYNIWDRVLVISSKTDGFDFYDIDNEFYFNTQQLFSLRNESLNTISLIMVTTSTKIITESNAELNDDSMNVIKLLRSKEEIVLRMHSTEQRSKLWEELDKGKNVRLLFDCEIKYITFANQQICYKYSVDILNTPMARTIDGKPSTANNRKINIIKDEYTVSDIKTIGDSRDASVFRNLQDRIEVDRVTYVHRKIGAAQAEGMIAEINRAGGLMANTTPKAEVEMINET